jgi:hypothetical protein
MTELPPPEEVRGDPNARELARVWAANGRQVIIFGADIWDDPADWGIFLVDFIKHISNAYGDLRGKDKLETIKRIREGFDAEWSAPTENI